MVSTWLKSIDLRFLFQEIENPYGMLLTPSGTLKFSVVLPEG